jgi:hypothetical protein
MIWHRKHLTSEMLIRAMNITQAEQPSAMFDGPSLLSSRRRGLIKDQRSVFRVLMGAMNMPG